MKAALLHATSEPLTVEEIDIIDPRPNEVRIKTMVSGVCHSDLHFVNGTWPMRLSRWSLSRAVTERLGLAGINVAFDKMQKGEVARSVLEIGV